MAVRWISILSSTTVLALASSAAADTLSVGPGQTYAAPCAAFAAAADGDTIEIDADGDYDGDVCAIARNSLTIRGVGGRAHIDAAGSAAQGKGTWVVQGDDTTIEDIELSGATVVDLNGAGIRQEGANLTVRRCYFHDNENGILAGDVAGSEILIEYSEFARNGAGDGYSHNLYINHVAKLTFQFNWSHSASIGHLLKSRAAETYVLYNRLTGESDGTQSYEIDVPNGGKTWIVGNLIQQDTGTDNPSLVAYMEEGAHANNPSGELFVVNNSFVNDLGSGTFINIGGSALVPAVIKNNVFAGGGTLTNQAGAVLAGNHSDASCFVDMAAFDYHLLEGSACVDAGVDVQDGDGQPFLPQFHYLHPTEREARASVGTIDIGAYELGGGSEAGTGGQGTAGSAAAGSAGTVSGGSAGSAAGGAATSGGGGQTSTGGSAATAGAAPATSSGSGDDGGCGCRSARGRQGAGLSALILAALTLSRRLRRRLRRN